MDVTWASEFGFEQQRFRHVDAADPHAGPALGSTDLLDGSFCVRVLDGRLPNVITDARANPATRDLPVTAALNSYIGVPIRHGDGRVRGMLCRTSDAARPDLADQAAIAQGSGIAVRERTPRAMEGTGWSSSRSWTSAPAPPSRLRCSPDSSARPGAPTSGSPTPRRSGCGPLWNSPAPRRPWPCSTGPTRPPGGQHQPLPRRRRQRRGRHTARRRRPAASSRSPSTPRLRTIPRSFVRWNRTGPPVSASRSMTSAPDTPAFGTSCARSASGSTCPWSGTSNSTPSGRPSPRRWSPWPGPPARS
jgi:hypothetical protein